MNPALGGIAGHAAQLLVHQRLPAYEQQIPNVVPHADIDHIPRFLQRDAAPFCGVEPVHCKPAKIAFRVANVGDRELQIARPAVIEHLAKKLKSAGLGSRDRA